MRKLWVVGALALGAIACEEPPQPPSPEYVVAAFDPSAVPPVVPTPNDLAINPKTGLVEAPVDPSAPLAQQEFTRDYLNTLDGFPTTAVASTRVDGLDPSTLGPKGVLLIDLKPGTGQPVSPELDYDEEKGLLTVTPPRSGWPKGGHFAVAVIGGANGVKGVGGKEVVASPAWFLLRFPTPLVQCSPGAERTPANCRATTNLIPSTQQDVLARRKEQAATALRLEELRVRYAPVLDSLEAQGIPRQDVALLWTFKVVSLPEVTFDPQRNVIPFPNDLLLTRDATTGATRVNLPMPPSTAPAEQKALVEGLNRLDGFSTTAPIVSENSDTLGAIDVGRLDASLLTASSRFVKVTARGAVPQSNVEVCLNCASSKRADGSVATGNPSQLQFVPRLPLEEKSTYAVALTTGLKNEQGQRVVPAAAFALLRSSAELVDASGRSLVSGVLDAQAQQLEKGRKALKPLVDGLVAGGIARKDLLLSWAFTTQSTVSTLKQLHDLPATVGAVNEKLPDAPRYVEDVSTALFARMDLLKLPRGNIGKVFQGQLTVPFALTGPNGTLRPEVLRFDRVPFLLVMPSSTAPETGFPVTLFGHGLRGNHQHLLAVSNALAGSGRAVFAIDTVKHGERSMCLGSAAVLRSQANPNPTDDQACDDPVTQRCDNEPASPTFGRCIARPGVQRTLCAFSDPKADLTCAAARSGRGEGRCLDTDPTGDNDQCEGGTFRKNADGSVTISGWNMLDLQNFFVTRDNFRHQVMDLAQVVRVLQGPGLDEQLVAAGGSPVDGTHLDYVGQSLGGMLGTLYTAVSPDVRRAVLNVPGGRLPQVLDEATDANFVAMRTGLYSNLATMGMPQGSPAFDTFIRTAQWILDPGDPINAAWHVTNGPNVPAERRALVQYITGDKIIPNSTTRALIDAVNARPGARPLSTREFNPTLAELPENARHGFLANGANPTVTQQAQEEVVQFLTQP
jgi:dienelactone hydrolase